MVRSPDESRDEGKLFRHGPEEAELLQVPQLERSSGEGEDEVLLGVGDPEHRDLGLLSAVSSQHAEQNNVH